MRCNPRLIYCSITGYGRDNRHADRPGFDALVAARTGLQWEQRAWTGSPMDHILGSDGPNPELTPPDGCAQGAAREGPLFVHSAWPSLNAFYLATLAICGALRAREITGRGQWVETSLLQGVISSCVAAWARVENIDAPAYRTWVLDRRSPKGLMECRGGRWVHQWPINPFAVVEAAKADTLDEVTEIARNKDHPARIGMDPDELALLFYYHPLMAEAFKKFTPEEWTRFGARLDVGLQPVRTPEEALKDPNLLATAAWLKSTIPNLDGSATLVRFSASKHAPIGSRDLHRAPASTTTKSAPRRWRRRVITDGWPAVPAVRWVRHWKELRCSILASRWPDPSDPRCWRIWARR